MKKLWYWADVLLHVDHICILDDRLCLNPRSVRMNIYNSEFILEKRRVVQEFKTWLSTFSVPHPLLSFLFTKEASNKNVKDHRS